MNIFITFPPIIIYIYIFNHNFFPNCIQIKHSFKEKGHTSTTYKHNSYRQTNYLISNPLFSNRIKFIKFAREDYNYKNRTAMFSIVISTYERVSCFRNVFQKIIKYRPQNTEIVICDDNSQSNEKKNILKMIANNYSSNDVYIISHIHNFGAFHTKLDGFLFSVGEYIMSIDDDDDFDSHYYIELSEHVSKANSYNEKYDFVMPSRNKDFSWVRFPITIRTMISSYHNHVTFAFKRELMMNVDYPEQNFKIYRDDAPLMIPLYIQSSDNKLYDYRNNCQYFVGKNDCKNENIIHEATFFKKNLTRIYFINGLRFIINYTKKCRKTQYIPTYRQAYSDRDIPPELFRI